MVGAVVELGQIVNVPTPTIAAVHAATQGLAQSVQKAGKGLAL
jgi:ketopantoate reductase